ncbi:MAG: peptidoglycan-binding protein [Clostridia bacterium]|nr:peptidoglycan-binding protein [Clostridia bacterium]
MFKVAQFIAFVLSMVGQKYWYGTCVYICTKSLLKSKTKQYPTHYGSSRTSTYEKHIAARHICMDCIGLIKGFFWTNGGEGVLEYLNGGAEYKNKYGSNGCPDKGANGMLSWLKSKGCKNGKIATMPDVPGILLFKSGHVGVYVGNGYAVEAQGFAYGVVKTKVSKRPWTEWAYLPASLIDYGDASSVTDNTPAVTPEAKPTTRKLGDRTLKRTSPMMTGDDVVELQTRLNALGFDCGEVDGKFGKNTEKGVKAFQTAAKIEVDGKFGKESMAALTAYSKPQDEPEKVEPEQPEITVPDETVYPIHGFIPDISVYQEAIDMDKFCAGNDFAILRARVNGKDDTKFAGWAVELKKRGFPFAVYDYLKLKSEADAVEQADAMYAACAPYDPKVYYLDTEELADGMTYEVERELIKVYVKRLREHGVKVIGQYTGDYRWRTSYREIESIFDTLWIANWGANEGTYTGWEIKSAAFTDKIYLHQYTSNGYSKVAGAPGIDHRIDLNRLTGAVPLSWFTGRKYAENAVQPTYASYVVQSGDSLWKIAKNLLGDGRRWTEIAALNEIENTIIHTGEVLKIPE